MKAPKDRMEMLLEAIYSKVERMEGIMDKAPTSSKDATTTPVSPNKSELEEIKRQLTDIQEDLNKTNVAATATEKHHYLWIFPDLREWVSTLNRGKFVVLFSLLSVGLVAFIFLKYPDYNQYQEGYYKYQYLFHASGDMESLKKYNAEWGWIVYGG